MGNTGKNPCLRVKYLSIWIWGKRVVIKRRLAVAIFLVCACQVVFPGSSDRSIGFGASVFSSTVTLRYAIGKVALDASVQYPIVPALVVMAMEGTCMPALFVWSLGAYGEVYEGNRFSLWAGPSVWTITKAFARMVVTTYGVDVQLVFDPRKDSEYWSLGFMIPMILQGEMVHSDSSVAWAWEEFGLAIVPTVRVMWRF